MNLEPWAIRARARLQAAIVELEDPDSQILGLCVVALRESYDGQRFSSCSGSLGPQCSPNDMAAALRVESGATQKGEGCITVSEVGGLN